MVCGANFDISYQKSGGSGRNSINELYIIALQNINNGFENAAVRICGSDDDDFLRAFTSLKDREPSGNLGVLIATTHGMRVPIAIAAFSFPAARHD